MLTTLQSAKVAQLSIVVPGHCIEELNRLLDALEQNGPVEAVGRSLAAGDDPYVLAQTIDDTALEAWLSHSGPGRHISWEQYRARATKLSEHLTSLGANVTQLPDTDGVLQLHRRLTGLMRDVLRERPRAGQGDSGPREEAVRDDGATLAMAALIRESEDRRRFWPYAWVLTPDRRMGDAYRKHNPDDEFPITLQPAQLAALLATFVNPADASQLANAAATMLSHDTFLYVAVRYPADVAVKIARTLRGDGEASEIDVRLAQQTTIDELLGESRPAPDVLPDHVAAAVADKRARRREALATAELDRARRERDDAQRARKQAEADRDTTAESSRAAAEVAARRHRAQEDALRAKLRDQEVASEEAAQRADAEAARARIYRRRGTIAVVGVAMLAAAAALGLATSLSGLAVGTALSAIVLFIKGWEWAEESRLPWVRFPVTLLPELIGIWDLVR